MSHNFALIGAAGYIAPRHFKAIQDTGNKLVAATDPHDAVGILDRFGMDISYFKEIERFDRHLEKLHRGPKEGHVKYVSICTPNFLHDAHIRLAMRVGADAICEKPLVIKPWNLDALTELEGETGRRVYTVLQLREHPALQALHQKLSAEKPKDKHEVVLTYITSRGRWYDYSWKGDLDRSGGVAMNIGIHFFDMLMWFFGPVEHVELHQLAPRRAAGFIELEHARVRWLLSLEQMDLPAQTKKDNKTTYRSITVDGQEIEFTEGFTDLHTRVYQGILANRGYGIKDARPSIELVHKISTSEISAIGNKGHPFLV